MLLDFCLWLLYLVIVVVVMVIVVVVVVVMVIVVVVMVIVTAVTYCLFVIRCSRFLDVTAYRSLPDIHDGQSNLLFAD